MEEYRDKLPYDALGDYTSLFELMRKKVEEDMNTEDINDGRDDDNSTSCIIK